MDIVKNLICLERGKASVIRLIAGKLEYVKKDGETEFDITMDFWDWWKKVLSYIDGDPVDICFVCDKKYDLLKEEFITQKNIINSEETIWKVEYIKDYFWTLKANYFNLVIVGPEQQEYHLSPNNDGVARRFETNLNFKLTASKTKRFAREPKQEVQEEEYSEFAKFFVDLIRRERS